jgi:hypothetical protein
VKRRIDRIYFVFNNMVTSSSQNAETVFLGLEVRAISDSNRISLKMRREGDSWESGSDSAQIVADDKDALSLAKAYSTFSLSAVTREGQLRGRVYGAIRPRPQAELINTWNSHNQLEYLRELLSAEPTTGRDITIVWTSFDQRTAQPSFLAEARCDRNTCRQSREH